jgi:hypothetical protein
MSLIAADRTYEATTPTNIEIYETWARRTSETFAVTIEKAASQERLAWLGRIHQGRHVHSAPQATERYGLSAGAGLINSRFQALLDQIENRVPLHGSEEANARVSKIAESLAARRNEDIDAWAERVANDVADCTD